MIPDYKLYHGAVLSDIIDRADIPVSFQETSEAGRLLNYVINGRIGLQLKYATQRLRPWHFSFPASHVEALLHLRHRYARTFLALVCRTDGIIAVDADEVIPSLIATGDNQAWLRADRKKREMYRLYGPAGEFGKRFSTTTEPIVEALRSLNGEGLNNLVTHALP